MAHTFFDYYKLLFDKGLVSYCDFYDCESTPVRSICYNSSNAKPGCLFVCKGESFKREYLISAIELGASFYISEKKYSINSDVPYIIVSDVRKALAEISNMFFNYPSRSLQTFAVTGTKGKSTVCLFIKQILDAHYASLNKAQCGMISTIETFDGLTYEESVNSTPESYELQRFLANGVCAKLEGFSVEVSSQGIKQCRIHGIEFDTGVFLNIGQDHISPNEHKDFEDYFSTKLRLFDQCKRAVVNTDCEFSDRILQNAVDNCDTVVTFGKTPASDVYVYDMSKSGSSTVFRCRTDDYDEEFTLSVPGFFNVENVAAAIAATMHLGISAQTVRKAIENVKVPGRMEMYSTKDNSIAICTDYAHNALSFETLITSLRAEYPGRRLLMVFGAPGGKALNRRRDLGTASGKLADHTYITSDDPNFEDPEQIAREIAVYVENAGGSYDIIVDREEAIRTAFKNAPAGSIIVLAGKGRQGYVVVNGSNVPYKRDDEIAVELIEEYDKLTLA